MRKFKFMYNPLGSNRFSFAQAEIACALKIAAVSTTVVGPEQYAMRAFADALEGIELLMLSKVHIYI